MEPTTTFEPIKTYEDYRRLFPWYPPSCLTCDGSGEIADEVQCGDCKGLGSTDEVLDVEKDRAQWENRSHDIYVVTDGWCAAVGGFAKVERILQDHFRSTWDRVRKSNGSFLIRSDYAPFFYFQMPRD